MHQVIKLAARCAVRQATKLEIWPLEGAARGQESDTGEHDLLEHGDPGVRDFACGSDERFQDRPPRENFRLTTNYA